MTVHGGCVGDEKDKDQTNFLEHSLEPEWPLELLGGQCTPLTDDNDGIVDDEVPVESGVVACASIRSLTVVQAKIKEVG